MAQPVTEPTRIDQAGTSLASAFGYFAIVPEALLDSEVSDRAVRLWARLYREADRSRHQARVTRRAMAWWLHKPGGGAVSVDTVDRALAELEAAGWLAVARERQENNRNLPSLYTLLNATPPSEGTAPTPRVGRNPAAQGAPHTSGPVGRTDAAQKPKSEKPENTVDAAGAAVSSSLVLLDEPSTNPTTTDVWNAYLATRNALGRGTGSLAFTKVRRDLIEDRMKSHGAEAVLAAVRGWAHDPWVRGENPDSRFYATLEFVLRGTRNADNVERFAELQAHAEAGTLPAPAQAPASKGQAVWDEAAQAWQAARKSGVSW